MKSKKLPGFLVILILTSITIMFWILFSIYQVFSKKPNEVVPTEILLQITPTLDMEIVNQIRGKI